MLKVAATAAACLEAALTSRVCAGRADRCRPRHSRPSVQYTTQLASQRRSQSVSHSDSACLGVLGNVQSDGHTTCVCGGRRAANLLNVKASFCRNSCLLA